MADVTPKGLEEIGPTAAPTPTVGGQDQPAPADDELRQAIANAECLVAYAAEAGVEVPADQIEAVLAGRAAVLRGACTRAQVVAFYAAYAKIAARLSPVNADTIRACASPEAAQNLERNGRRAVILTVIIVALSMLAFVDNAISNKIAGEITEVNATIVRLHNLIQSNGLAGDHDFCGAIHQAATRDKPLGLDDVTQLQQFASGLRNIYGNAIKLNYFVALIEVNPLSVRAAGKEPPNVEDQLQLDPALVNFDAEVVCKISAYEKVRDFAQNVSLDNSVFFGALAAYILPVAYALLGAMAFRLRTFADTIRKRTYHPSYADSARLIAALIAGSIVSLFNNFTPGRIALAVGGRVPRGLWRGDLLHVHRHDLELVRLRHGRAAAGGSAGVRRTWPTVGCRLWRRCSRARAAGSTGSTT